LANALRGNECLTHLDLSHNDLQRPAGEAVVRCRNSWKKWETMGKNISKLI